MDGAPDSGRLSKPQARVVEVVLRAATVEEGRWKRPSNLRQLRNQSN
jgi:hypothetical protein